MKKHIESSTKKDSSKTQEKTNPILKGHATNYDKKIENLSVDFCLEQIYESITKKDYTNALLYYNKIIDSKDVDFGSKNINFVYYQVYYALGNLYKQLLKNKVYIKNEVSILPESLNCFGYEPEEFIKRITAQNSIENFRLAFNQCKYISDDFILELEENANDANATGIICSAIYKMSIISQLLCNFNESLNKDNGETFASFRNDIKIALRYIKKVKKINDEAYNKNFIPLKNFLDDLLNSNHMSENLEGNIVLLSGSSEDDIDIFAYESK